MTAQQRRHYRKGGAPPEPVKLTDDGSGCPVCDRRLTHFALRVVQDALAEGTAAYWLRRAAMLDAARPRPGDFRGRSNVDDLAARDARLAAAADACRAAAALAQRGDYP